MKQTEDVVWFWASEDPVMWVLAPRLSSGDKVVPHFGYDCAQVMKKHLTHGTAVVQGVVTVVWTALPAPGTKAYEKAVAPPIRTFGWVGKAPDWA